MLSIFGFLRNSFNALRSSFAAIIRCFFSVFLTTPPARATSFFAACTLNAFFCWPNLSAPFPVKDTSSVPIRTSDVISSLNFTMYRSPGSSSEPKPIFLNRLSKLLFNFEEKDCFLASTFTGAFSWAIALWPAKAKETAMAAAVIHVCFLFFIFKIYFLFICLVVSALLLSCFRNFLLCFDIQV